MQLAAPSMSYIYYCLSLAEVGCNWHLEVEISKSMRWCYIVSTHVLQRIGQRANGGRGAQA